jgi:S1-C subfamily serine protease
MKQLRIKIENKEVNTYSELNEILSQLSPGDKVKVEINREGKTIEKTVTLLNENGNTEIIKK